MIKYSGPMAYTYLKYLCMVLIIAFKNKKNTFFYKKSIQQSDTLFDENKTHLWMIIFALLNYMQ